jgi:hypothetical protein
MISQASYRDEAGRTHLDSASVRSLALPLSLRVRLVIVRQLLNDLLRLVDIGELSGFETEALHKGRPAAIGLDDCLFGGCQSRF